jgi:tetratricopeptide (TPR) repeat protein
MRRLDLVSLSVVLLAMCLLAGGLYAAHEIQVRRNASALLDRAGRAEAQNDLKTAEVALERFLKLNPRDKLGWQSYARVVDARNTDPRRRERERVYLVHTQALRFNPDDMKLLRRCADLAIELGRFQDAHRYLWKLLEKVARDSQGKPVAAERGAAAELEERLGDCERGLARFAEARTRYETAIDPSYDPTRVSAYDALARLLRADKQTELADARIAEMVAENPKSGRAYLNRWLYAREFLPSADPKDLAKDLKLALELAPQDPEVLWSVGRATSERNQDLALARSCYEKGCRLYPERTGFAVALAGLESRAGNLDRAEAALRKADQAHPSVELAFHLADVLILQGKLDDKDLADCISRLTNAGLSETLVRYLEAKTLIQQEKWSDAIRKIENARAALQSNPPLARELERKLATCYGRIGCDEQRLDALRRAGGGDTGGGSQAPDSLRAEYALALAQAGALDEAIVKLTALVERNPELRLDLVRQVLNRTLRQPRDRRNWNEVERQLGEAEKNLPRSVEPLALLRADILIEQERFDEAGALLAAAQARDPRNLKYRLAAARMMEKQGKGPAALQVLEQAEKDLGPSLDLQLARLRHWAAEGGEPARAAVAKLAADRQRIPSADRPAFLERLGAVENQLGQPALARQHYRELADLKPNNVQVLTALFELAMQSADSSEAQELVTKMRALEGEDGTLWRFAQASSLLDQSRRSPAGSRDLELPLPQRLAQEIAQSRPDWWGSFVLQAEIADLRGQNDEARKHYARAIELGNNSRTVARRLVALLNEAKEFDQIERVVKRLSDRGVPSRELVLSAATAAMRQRNYDEGIKLAHQLYSESSTNFADHLAMGQFYTTAGRSREAGRAFARAVKLGPGVPAAWLSYIQYLVQQKQLDQARAQVAEARRSLPADRAELVLAQCHRLIGDIPQAEALIQRAVESPSCDLETIRFATDFYLALGRFDRVEPIVDRLRAPTMKATPEVLAWANRVRCRVKLGTGRLGDADQALRLVEQNLEANPASKDDLRLKATILARRTSRWGEAAKLLETLDAAGQLDASEQFRLAQIYLASHLEDKYRAQMLNVLGGEVRSPQYVAQFAKFLIEHQDIARAQPWIAELKDIAPPSMNQVVLELEASVLQARNQDRELLALLQSRLREAPDQAGAVAVLLDRFGFDSEAEKAFKAYVARNPGEPERVLALASFLARHDRAAEAVAILERAWQTCRPERVAEASLPLFVAPSSNDGIRRQVEAWVSEAIRTGPTAAAALQPKLATMYTRQGRYAEAEALYRQCLQSDPDDVNALNDLAWMLALRDRARCPEALELVNRAIEQGGRRSNLVDTRAVVLIQSGQAAIAAGELRAARALDPRNLSLALHLAWACLEAGSRDEARDALQQAEAIGLKPETRDPLERGVIARLRQELGPGRASPPEHR